MTCVHVLARGLGEGARFCRGFHNTMRVRMFLVTGKGVGFGKVRLIALLGTFFLLNGSGNCRLIVKFVFLPSPS